MIEGVQVGLIRPDIYKHLLDYKDVFTFHGKYLDYRVGAVELNANLKTYEERSVHVERVLKELREKKCLVALNGWRNEVSD